MREPASTLVRPRALPVETNLRIVVRVALALAACVAVQAPVRAQPPETTDGPVLLPPVREPGPHGHPPYPENADGEPARVRLHLVIDAEGTVTEATVLSTDRNDASKERFEALAVEYAKGLRFTPATRDGEPVAARIGFDVLFNAEVKPDHPHPAQTGETPHLHTPRLPAPGTEVQTGPTPPSPQPDERSSFSATAVVPAPDVSASSIELTGEELRLRPYLSTGDLLNAVPGFYSIQHAGGGKANQYFLRGFDGDHGTDIAFYVDGVPINMVTHGHGQGYTDLHFVIPELIDRIEVSKGPYFAEYGDFSTAGTVNVVLDTEQPKSSVSLLGGTYSTSRGVAIATRRSSARSTG